MNYIRIVAFMLIISTGIGFSQTFYKNADNPNIVCNAMTIGTDGLMWNCNVNSGAFVQFRKVLPKTENTVKTYVYSNAFMNFSISEDMKIIVIQTANYRTVYVKINAPKQTQLPPSYMNNDCDLLDRELATGRCPSRRYTPSVPNINSCLEQADAALRSADLMGTSLSATMLRQRAIQQKHDCYH